MKTMRNGQRIRQLTEAENNVHSYQTHEECSKKSPSIRIKEYIHKFKKK